MSLLSPVFGEKMQNSITHGNSVFMTKTCIGGAIWYCTFRIFSFERSFDFAQF